VIAAEYPGILPKVGAYCFATAISISRVTGRNHFPSDALVGTTFGYLIGGYVYRHHSADFDENMAVVVSPDFD
jgi:membrane-associated phospholipid phosphatase